MSTLRLRIFTSVPIDNIEFEAYPCHAVLTRSEHVFHATTRLIAVFSDPMDAELLVRRLAGVSSATNVDPNGARTFSVTPRSIFTGGRVYLGEGFQRKDNETTYSYWIQSSPCEIYQAAPRNNTVENVQQDGALETRMHAWLDGFAAAEMYRMQSQQHSLREGFSNDHPVATQHPAIRAAEEEKVEAEATPSSNPPPEANDAGQRRGSRLPSRGKRKEARAGMTNFPLATDSSHGDIGRDLE